MRTAYPTRQMWHLSAEASRAKAAPLSQLHFTIYHKPWEYTAATLLH